VDWERLHRYKLAPYAAAPGLSRKFRLITQATKTPHQVSSLGMTISMPRRPITRLPWCI
jgi:hypothetical protein